MSDDWASEAEADVWLLRVMQSAKNKAMIASLEENLRGFVNDQQGVSELPFPPRGPFHRKVCYLVARRYGLSHRLEQAGSEIRLVLLRTTHAAVPVRTLGELASMDAGADSNTGGGTKFLRRPTTKDGKASVEAAKLATRTQNGPAANCGALRNISEEDYRKARARIFKNAKEEIQRGQLDDDTVRSDDGVKIVKAPRIAKGPVEGTTGFDRRRNRRPQPPKQHQSVSIEKAKRRNTGSDKGSNEDCSINHTEDLNSTNRSSSRNERNSRTPLDSNTRGATSNATSNGNEARLSFDSSGLRRSNLYSSFVTDDSDRQDPDFDRRYDKWAVRHPTIPHSQHQVPLPIFGHLLYPYSVQSANQSMHQAPVHVRAVNASGALSHSSSGPYPTMQMQHTGGSRGTIMFEHFGQGIGGLAEYASRGLSLTERGVTYEMAAVDQLGMNHSRQMSNLQGPSMASQGGRRPAPAYGLDSTVDFPPLQ